MAISKDKKGQILEKLRGVTSSASTIVFVNFHGLTVAEERELRSKLRAEGVDYMVAKKTLIKKALGEKGVTGTLPELSGEVALAYSADELAPARETSLFAKTHEGHLALLGGVFEGSYVDQSGIKAIASIPGMQTLRAQFVQLINSPRQRFAVVLGQFAEKSRQ